MIQTPHNNSASATKELKKCRYRNRTDTYGSNGTNDTQKSPLAEAQSLQKSVGHPLPKKSLKRPPKISSRTTEDRRYEEIAKLVKRFVPITVNGLAVSCILPPRSPTETRDQNATSERKKLSKSEKLALISSHIRQVLAKNPSQPLYLSFFLIPSDPDFPYNFELLNFNLTIPANYPRSANTLPSLLVLNTDIPRGFAINIERLYSDIARLALGGTIDNPEIALINGKGLLSQFQTFDRNLKYALKQDKRATLKFVSFKHSTPSPDTSPAPKDTQKEEQKIQLSRIEEKVNSKRSNKLQEARNFAVEQMCAKLASLIHLLHRSSDGEKYKIAIPVKDARLPKLWTFENNWVDVFLTIPPEYPIAEPKVNVATNFSNNLLVANKAKLAAQGYSFSSLMEEASVAETNLRGNVRARICGETESSRSEPLSLVLIINWIANDIEHITQLPDKFMEWKRLMLRMKSASIGSAPTSVSS